MRALSQPHHVQESLFPDFVEIADELALGWEEVIRAHIHLTDDPKIFTVEQKAAFLNLDNHLLLMSGEDNAQCWTMEALAHSAEWKIVRDLAMQALILMKWPLTPPPQNSDIYIGSPS